MGIFIRIKIDNNKLSSGIAMHLASLCPVEIFTLIGDQLHTNKDQEDECTLCGLCLEDAPEGAITILKMYSDKELVSHGERKII